MPPILITELGLSTGPSTIAKAYSESDQASWLVKKHILAIAGGVAQFYWFKMKDDRSETNPDGYWGLVRHDFSPKPSAKAYSLMSRLLSNARCVGAAYNIAQDTRRNGDFAFWN